MRRCMVLGGVRMTMVMTIIMDIRMSICMIMVMVTRMDIRMIMDMVIPTDMDMITPLMDIPTDIITQLMAVTLYSMVRATPTPTNT